MGFEKEKLKQVRYLILFVAAVVLLIIYSGNVMNGLRLFLGMLSPFIVGGAIAFVLNIPLKAVENKLLKKWKGKLAAKLKASCEYFCPFLILLWRLLRLS